MQKIDDLKQAHLNTSQGFKAHKGLTLIELLVAVAIVALVAAIAVPGYNRQVTNTYRNSAISCLTEISTWMETYRASSFSYEGATVPQIQCVADIEEFYTFSISSNQPNQFEVIAAAKGRQIEEDTGCTRLTTNQLNQQTPTTCWE